MQSRYLQKLLNTTRAIADFGDHIGVGSYLCHDLISVNKKTMGMRYALDTFHEGRKSIKDQELEAIWDKLEEIIKTGLLPEIIAGFDNIPEDKRIPVFYEHNHEIIESYCDALGWPNVTYDGVLMYNNTHYPTRKQAVDEAIKEMLASIKIRKERREELEADIESINIEIKLDEEFLEKLKKEQSHE